MDSLAGLRSDLQELESFMTLSKRPSVRRILSENCERLRGQVQEIERLVETAAQETLPAEVFNSIDRFAWDQTSDFVKVYVQLEGLGNLPSDATSAQFEKESAELIVRKLHQKNYSLKFQPLYAPIDAEKSNFSIKRDTATLRLAKLRRGQHWESVTQNTRQKNAIPKPDISGDPSESIMNMMKSLYNQGDSEMKRTIAKAWTESQERKMKGMLNDDGAF